MVSGREQDIEHLFRRAGFGASPQEITDFARLGFVGFSSAAAHLLDYSRIADDVDSLIGVPGYAGITAPGGFAPTTNIAHARQRWLFRMVHSRRPLQEKMALFWHNHFATAYSKVSGELGATEGARVFAAKPAEDSGGAKGQLELLREHALGNFRDLLVAIAQDPAMLVWLDGRSNVRAQPQENFARELMELFTMGVGTFAEADVYAGARVFTGWNLSRPGSGAAQHYAFNYNAALHDTEAKTFTFPIYRSGSTTIPARSAGSGMQDGVDLINAVAAHPATGPRLARKLYAFFINEVDPPDTGLVNEVAQIYYARGFAIEPMVRRLLLSTQFRDPRNYYKRYSWPAEFVVRSLKEVGPAGFSVNDALSPLVNMGQQLFEPPDVNGWELGAGWFSTGSMLARMNFAAQLATNQKFNLRDGARAHADTADALLTHVLDRLTAPQYSSSSQSALGDYARTGATYPLSDAQLATKVAGLVHLVVGSGDYQFV
ncbi:MAG TPA: DUF1800 domain-containing protein [Vicinamibacterales bacterium]|jgi:uncharacterized protein (DUF1800 family)|nr:DUF1800 domain-containing protein [Vicinamibacterales bacterium]